MRESTLVEPLLHIAVPFASLRAVGLERRKAIVASAIALAPDVDLVLHVHRSLSHSFVVLATVAVAIMAFSLLMPAAKQRTFRSVMLLGAFGVASHVVLDLFQGLTPILWPLLKDSFWISTALRLHMGSATAVTGSAELVVEPTLFESFTSFDAPILTPEGLGISLIILAPSLVQVLREKRAAPGKRMPR